MNGNVHRSTFKINSQFDDVRWNQYRQSRLMALNSFIAESEAADRFWS
jgi:hypothetical protein